MSDEMRGFNPYEGSDEVPDHGPDAIKNLGAVMRARSEESSSENESSNDYGELLIDQILENHPLLTRDEAEEMLSYLV
jgi:hypothetical protein